MSGALNDSLRKLHEDNRAGWNEGAEAYEADLEERIAFLRAGGCNFEPPELTYLHDLGSWCGRAIHLQCAGGTDTLSLLNLGAQEVVGVDISDRMIDVAKRKSEALGARASWYRCDILGGAATQSRYVDLPTTTHGLLRGRGNDQWMACVKGKSVSAGTTVPCTSKHDWRAVTTIKLGEPGQKYPGDAVAKAKTKSYCSDSVDAWLGYPADFDFAYTWFGQREWNAGNRRSVCWARTDR